VNFKFLQLPFTPLLLVLMAVGALWPLAFAPTSAWWLAQTALLSLLLVLTNTDKRVVSVISSAWMGLAFGLAAFLSGVYWLFFSLYDFGGMPLPVAAGGVFLLALYMALYPAMGAAAYTALLKYFGFQGQSSGVWAALVQAMLWASCWTACELARAWVFTGFPWLSLGDSLVDSPFRVFFPVLGSTCTAWLVVTLVSWVGLLLWSGSKKRPRLRDALPIAIVFAALGLLGITVVPTISNTEPIGKVRAALVQPNISQSIKFEPTLIVDNFTSTIELTRKAAEQLRPGDWLLLPETALPVLWHESPLYWREYFQNVAYENKVHLVMGSALDDQGHYTNSVIALSPQDKTPPELPTVRYDKRHLVPFGEFIPTGFKWFVAMMNMPLGDFDRGKGAPEAFGLGGFYLLPNVCYEDVFSREFANLVASSKPEPNILLNVSNLAWFGNSWAMDQHAQMSRARALELGKAMVRVTNTGITGVIDPHGQWLRHMPTNKAGFEVVELPLMRGLTPFARCPDGAWLGCVCLSILAAFSAKHRARYNNGSPALLH
jgi:apolipoprotein N-acyltransferase